MWQIRQYETRLWENWNVISSEMFVTYLTHAQHWGRYWEIVGEQDPWTLQFRKEDNLFHRNNTVEHR